MYRITTNGVQRLSDNANIPAVDNNRDWQEFQNWLKAGNTPIPARPSPYHTLNNDNEWIEDFERWINMAVRVQRDLKLEACDYIMMPDYPIDQSKRSEWEEYRKQLRDLPGTLTAVVEQIPWPLSPQ
ncbi:hypothetical protein DSLASN_05130 [Desulfoluna limicola]|uniref:Phage tail assembly chaperone-like domain-containing protein n=1 Tax=Desulfoluna limicola TaxID=2810562 RepID=A0ABM7PCK0_9BACT|nr:tail fiber assembly protein [Desulfoluna limicola]BCS94881.1 hypothetical protein DSLASN_05130 [Desulfoluna limicola]